MNTRAPAQCRYCGKAHALFDHEDGNCSWCGRSAVRHYHVTTRPSKCPPDAILFRDERPVRNRTRHYDPRGVYAWLTGMGVLEEAVQHRRWSDRVRDWKTGAQRPTERVLDSLLVEVGLHLSMVPENLLLERRPRQEEMPAHDAPPEFKAPDDPEEWAGAPGPLGLRPGPETGEPLTVGRDLLTIYLHRKRSEGARGQLVPIATPAPAVQSVPEAMAI
jgi:hypothetical protein